MFPTDTHEIGSAQKSHTHTHTHTYSSGVVWHFLGIIAQEMHSANTRYKKLAKVSGIEHSKFVLGKPDEVSLHYTRRAVTPKFLS
jgi:hypothetical protein